MSQAKRLKTSKITSFCKSTHAADEDQLSTSQLQEEEGASDRDEGVTEDASIDKTPPDGNQTNDSEWMSPNHPSPSSIPPKETKKQKNHFQAKWYKIYPWIHYDPSLKGVLCFTSMKAEKLGHLKMAKNKEPAFVTTGFDNWKKATERFESHKASESHKVALAIAAKSQPAIDVQMDSNLRKQQEESSQALIKVFKCLRFLLRQGLPFRGHTPEEGNFVQLLKLFWESDAGLNNHLQQAISFTSPQSQEEMIQMFCHQIVRTLAEGIAKNGPFGVMVDGTQDISGVEQESICFRHVDDNLIVYEDFVGLNELQNSCGEVICSMICDVIIRLSMSLDNLRAQTYDGAANMQGHFRGCQARVKERQPLALHFHCGSHVANLIMQPAASECPTVRDAIQWVHELGVLFKRSGKYKAIFEEIAINTSHDQPMKRSTIRPLCPTRWRCRLAAILSVKDNYKTVLESLREMASSVSSESAAKANGLLARFEKGETYLSLEMVTKPIAALEQLNRSCQARSAVVSGTIEAVSETTNQMTAWRTDEEFHALYENAVSKADELELDPLRLPRKRNPPPRFTGPATSFNPTSPEQHYRQQYRTFVDAVVVQLNERYDQSKTDLASYKLLEDMLLSGKVADESFIQKYPELKKDTLAVQLAMFKQTTEACSLHEAEVAYRDMTKEVRDLFPQVVILLNLLLVCPVSSGECERSFSSLRRLKTWLRSTMTQRRLNAVAVCNSHHDMLDNISVQSLAKEFANRSERRRQTFGHFFG